MRLVRLFFALLLLTSAFVYAAETFEQLKSQYDKLESASTDRQSLNSLGDKFYKLYASSPSAKNADNAILYAGKCYKLSYERFNNSSDITAAIKYLRITSTNYSTDAAAEAYLESAELFMQKNDLASAQFALKRIITRFPDTEHELAANSMLLDLEKMAVNSKRPMDTTFTIPPTEPIEVAKIEPKNDKAEDNIVGKDELADIIEDPKPTGTTAIKDIRYFSGNDYTRIVIDLSQNAKIEKHWLKEDKSAKLPPRLFVDIFDSAVENRVPRDISIKDGLVKSVRWAYNKPGVTRIVLDSEAIKDFTVFQMANPSRIVIDVSGEVKIATNTNNLSSGYVPGIAKDGEQTIVDVFGLKIKTIVIDPGHGGKDPGCVHNGLKEKDIVLDISKQLKTLIEQNHKDIKVYLTRDKDIFLPLEERTAIANKYKADLFISIHINAAKNNKAKGIETYVLNVTNDKNSLEVAAFENQATTKSISDLQGILKDIMLNSKLEESLILAAHVQNNVVSALKTPKKEDLGVKQAPFYVLVGAMMPSVLIEAGFLSNKDEAAKLKTANHRKDIAKGIFKGVDAYIKKYNK